MAKKKKTLSLTKPVKPIQHRKITLDDWLKLQGEVKLLYNRMQEYEDTVSELKSEVRSLTWASRDSQW